LAEAPFFPEVTMLEPSAIEVASCSSRSQTMLPALVLGMAAFLTQFDVTAVVVAMPAIGIALGFGVAGYAWVMDAYSLAFTGTFGRPERWRQSRLASDRPNGPPCSSAPAMFAIS
jgi:hypothetical protein